MDSTESYTHFDTMEECDQFVNTLPISYVLGRCCRGKGVCLGTPIFYSIMNNPKQFPVQPTKEEKHIKKHTEDTICCVCYEDSSDLTSCGHLVCKKCLPKCLPLGCPYCRQPLFV